LPLAHGISGVKDLPVPAWLFYYGGAVVLIVSFVALALVWNRPRLAAAATGRPLLPNVQRILLSAPLRIALGAVSFGLLVVVGLAALLGERSPLQNIAPTFVYVLFWLGLVPVVVLLGNVWPALNPWRAAADAVAWAWGAAGGGWEPLEYPRRLGRWPAAVLLACFTALELAYSNPANPRALALAIWLYSAVTWMGTLAFGRRAWFENAEGFSAYFALLGRMAPFTVRRRGEAREIVVRAPLTGLAVGRARPGTTAFVAVMLGSVAFDGVSRTGWWIDRRAQVAGSDLSATLLNGAGLAATIVAVAALFLGAIWVAEFVAGEHAHLRGALVFSLVPIALAYAVAHYFSFFVLQSQYAVPLASDPFGWGWDLFGTAGVRPDLALLSANTIWYVQVAALVGGHVLGLVLAHDRAVDLFEPSRAVRSQYALLALMVVYTVGGLWLLSIG
jgi:hypothetical protein